MLGAMEFLIIILLYFLVQNQPEIFFWKSVKIWNRYHHEYGVSLFIEHDVVLTPPKHNDNIPVADIASKFVFFAYHSHTAIYV